MEIAKWSYKKGQKNSQKGLIIKDGGGSMFCFLCVYRQHMKLQFISSKKIEVNWLFILKNQIMNIEPNILPVFEKKTSPFINTSRFTKFVFTILQKSSYKNYT